jgi:hypothetical protein
MLSVGENFDLVCADDMEAQFDRVSTRFEAALQHVVSKILFTTDREAPSAAAHVRRTFYEKHEASTPVSTAVQVAALAPPGAILEIHPTVAAPERAQSGARLLPLFSSRRRYGRYQRSRLPRARLTKSPTPSGSLILGR